VHRQLDALEDAGVAHQAGAAEPVLGDRLHREVGAGGLGAREEVLADEDVAPRLQPRAVERRVGDGEERRGGDGGGVAGEGDGLAGGEGDGVEGPVLGELLWWGGGGTEQRCQAICARWWDADGCSLSLLSRCTRPRTCTSSTHIAATQDTQPEECTPPVGDDDLGPQRVHHRRAQLVAALHRDLEVVKTGLVEGLREMRGLRRGRAGGGESRLPKECWEL
jgi:hypothetical protein